MLVLSRKINEAIVIGGQIRVFLTAIQGGQVRLAIEAPREDGIMRRELLSQDGPSAPTAPRQSRARPLPTRRRREDRAASPAHPDPVGTVD